MEERRIKDVEKISWFGYQGLIFTLVKSIVITIGSYIMYTNSQTDTHIASIIGFAISFIPVIIFLGISNNKYNMNIIDLNKKIFGNVFGNILNVIINISFIFLGALLLYSISQYIEIQYIPNTSALYVKIMLMLPVIYAATKSIATICRINEVIIFINLTSFILAFSGLIAEFDFSKLFPFLDNSLSSIIYSAVIFALSISMPLFLMTIIPQDKVYKNKFSYKKIILFYTISVCIVMFIIIATILIFGIDIINIYRYPIFMSLRKFSLFTIIERVEKLLALQFIVDVIVYLILTIYFVVNTIQKNIKINNKEGILSGVVGVAIILLATFGFKDTIEVNQILLNKFVYVLGIGVFAPMIITFIGTIIDKNVRKNTNYK